MRQFGIKGRPRANGFCLARVETLSARGPSRYNAATDLTPPICQMRTQMNGWR